MSKFTVRIYDTDFLAAFDKAQKLTRDKYTTQNAFIVDCIERGLGQIISDSQLDWKLLLSNEKVDTLQEDASMKEIKNMAKDLSEYTQRQMKTVKINHNVMFHLLSSMYNLLLGLNDGKNIPNEQIEKGFYDDLPERFDKVFDDLRRRYGL